MLTKISRIARKINPHGGINFVMGAIRRKGIPELIDNHLGERVKQAKYKYSDVVLGWIYANLCGAERLEDTTNLKEHFIEMPDTRFPSPDRIAGIFKSFSTPNTIKEGKAIHEYNINEPLNKLLLETALRLKLLKKGQQYYTLDYDNVVIETEKFDSQITYKKHFGYSPGVSFIGSLPVYVENRNGNMPPFYLMDETLTRNLSLLKEKGINVHRFRSDAAAYQKDVIELMNTKRIDFFIRARSSEALFSEAIDADDWVQVEINNQPMEITEIQFKPFGGSKSYRYIVQRNTDIIRKEKNKYTGDQYNYRAIITNNYTMSGEEVVRFYNQRGAIERNFDMLLNDFNWRRMPFSFLSSNTVFLILEAIASVVYRYIIIKFSQKVRFIKPTYRLKNFIFHFIAVSAEWLLYEKEKRLTVYSNKNYELLIT